MTSPFEEKQRVLNVLGEVGVSKSSLLVSGSAVMFLADIPRARPLGDIDLFVPTRTWFGILNRPSNDWELWTTDPMDKKRRCDPPYLISHMYGVEVNIFFQWRVRNVGDIDVNWFFNNSIELCGYNCVDPRLILDWKQQMGRNKDLEDILLLRQHLGIAEPFRGSAD